MRTAAPIIMTAILSSCQSDKKSDKQESTSQSPTTETTQAVALSAIDLESIGLVDPKLHKKSGKEDWKGEVFNEQALSQLKELGSIFSSSEALSTDSLKGIATSESRTPPLVPANLEEINSGNAFSIRRQSADDKPQPELPMAEAMNALLDPFDPGEEIRSKFKIFTVQFEGGQPQCNAFVQIFGKAKQSEATISRQARWHCSWLWPDNKKPPLLHSIKVIEFEETRSPRLFADSSESVFKDVPSYQEQFLRGTEYWASRLETRYGIGISGWHGMALGDANGDGLDDLYVCEPGGLPNRLYLANPDGTVRDFSAESETHFQLQTQSALFLDLDNDGDQDLVLATTLGIVFMENNGKAVFDVKSTKLVPESAPVSIAAADFDLDGDLDIYSASYSLRSSNTDEGDAAQLGRPIPYHDANNGGRNIMFRNDRNWKFTDVTIEIGLDQNNRRYSFAPSWEDYDDDGDPDLYVANDYGRNNLFRNDRDADGNVHFTDVAAQAGVEDLSAGMSSSWGDVDGDGDRDLYVSNMWSSAGNRIAYQRNFQTSFDESLRSDFQRHARGNSLFLNNGDGTFSDVSVDAGVTMGRWAWGSRFVDINNDSRQDIIVSNGFLTQADTGDL